MKREVVIDENKKCRFIELGLIHRYYWIVEREQSVKYVDFMVAEQKM